MKFIKGYENIYSITSDGQVWSHLRNKFIKPFERKKYLRVKLYLNGVSKCFDIHRLVAENFLDNPNNFPQVNHINSNTFDNKACNLEWCTAKKNVEHSYNSGNRKNIEKRNRLTRSQVKHIKLLLINNKNYTQLAKKFNTSRHSISRIDRGICFSEVK